ncbi:toll/interleukin-1 receptor domain-containing protein [Georgenia sp. EYE_87]|uniref:toll/interleukin-1 receptor domain-containing protein n=1 Tax=Georgenia sp. EYE_87 TaxID=2853448 RepID=UPI002005139A|nr:toll/interleukin-1 receptor domain-containing protein [Georgenia sp. EYE_87]MCK6211591.1 toll/interleukin-1 receptor domain-containing protein [Georgenia sp. EYE_87]
MTRRSGFISYSRVDETCAAELESDLASLGVDAWRDQKLSGGQAWWDTVLASIEAADVFVFLISVSSLESFPCARELEYAAALGKQILPVRIDLTVEPRRTSPLLASLEWTDYLPADKPSYLRLREAVEHLPPSPPPPDPPPAPPPVPLSYTTNLMAMAHRERDLTPDEQFSLLHQLEHGLRTPADREECLAILRILRGRRDLLATVAADIDALLAPAGPPRAPAGPAAGAGAGHVAPPPTVPPAPSPHADRTAPDGGPTRVAPRVEPVRTAAAPSGPPPPRVVDGGSWQGAPGAVAPPARRHRVWPVLVLTVVLLFGGLVLAGSLVSGGGPSPDPGIQTPQQPGAPRDQDLQPADPGGQTVDLGGQEPSVPQGPGDDAVLDDLLARCQALDMAACDALFDSAAPGTEYEQLGATCGGRLPPDGGTCAERSAVPAPPGLDPTLDALWNACAAGDAASCDTLFLSAPLGSDYEAFGSTCGNRVPPVEGSCVEVVG